MYKFVYVYTYIDIYRDTNAMSIQDVGDYSFGWILFVVLNLELSF